MEHTFFDTIRVQYRVAVKQSARARSLQLVASPEKGIVLVLPRHTPSIRFVEAFLKSRQHWIVRQQKRLSNILAQKHMPKRLTDGSPILWEGENYTLKTNSLPSGRVRPTIQLATEKKQILFALPEGKPLSDSQMKTTLKRWYIRQASIVIGKEVAEAAEQHQVTYARVAIKDMRSLWGSCSSKGRLSFTWRLMLVPPPIRHYVMHHELTHRVWRNHGKRFWERLQKFDPNARMHSRWLSREGAVLMSFLRADRK